MLQLKRYRRERNISQEKLAQAIGVSRSTVSMWEIEASQPDNDLLIVLADYLNVSIDDLLGHKPDKIPSESDRLYQAYLDADDAIRKAVNKLLDL